MTGQMYFHFLLKNAELAALAFDFVSDRAATGASIASMAEWVSQYEKLDHVGQRAVLDGVLMAMGGAYELAYHYLTVGEEVDIPVLLRRVISAFLLEAEIGDSAGSSSFASCVLDDRALKASDDFILAHILDE